MLGKRCWTQNFTYSLSGGSKNNTCATERACHYEISAKVHFGYPHPWIWPTFSYKFATAPHCAEYWCTCYCFLSCFFFFYCRPFRCSNHLFGPWVFWFFPWMLRACTCCACKFSVKSTAIIVLSAAPEAVNTSQPAFIGETRKNVYSTSPQHPL